MVAEMRGGDNGDGGGDTKNKLFSARFGELLERYEFPALKIGTTVHCLSLQGKMLVLRTVLGNI